MARPLRVEFAGACYHVINRGNYRRNLFSEDGAAQSFEIALGQAAERYRWRIHAYVVMRNHFHLAVELTEPNLSEGMRWLQATWARRFNNYRRIVGKPFQGRFKALLVQPGHCLAQVCHYIHLNPVRAKAMPPAKVVSYAWSSLPRFVSRTAAPWLDSDTVLKQAGDLHDTAHGWKKYLEYLEFLATDDEAKKRLAADRMSKGWCIGDPDFRRQMEKEVQRRGADLHRDRFEGIGSEELKAEREKHWEEQLQACARAANIRLDRLPVQKSAHPKVLLASAMKSSTSVTNQWLCDRLSMGKPASVSQFVKRWAQNDERRAAVETLLSGVKH